MQRRTSSLLHGLRGDQICDCPVGNFCFRRPVSTANRFSRKEKTWLSVRTNRSRDFRWRTKDNCRQKTNEKSAVSCFIRFQRVCDGVIAAASRRLFQILNQRLTSLASIRFLILVAPLRGMATIFKCSNPITRTAAVRYLQIN